MVVPHPIPYQGSKRSLAGRILGHFPRHTYRLIEPFAGSAAISLAALSAGYVERVLLGDSNCALIALWETIVHDPELLADAYEHLWHQQLGREQAYYFEVREQFNQAPSPALFLFLLTRCVKAAVRYNAAGAFNQSPDNRRRGTHPKTMRLSLRSAARLLHNRSDFLCADYRTVLARASADDLIYLDPPYQGTSKNRDPRYFESIQLEDFIAELALLNERNSAYILSYDGRTGAKTYGLPLPTHLELAHLELEAGRSTQATLLGRQDVTVESLYLSPALVARTSDEVRPIATMPMVTQMPLPGM